MEKRSHGKLKDNGLINGLYCAVFLIVFNYRFLTTTMFWNEKLYTYKPYFIRVFDVITFLLIAMAVYTVIFLMDGWKERLTALILLLIPAAYSFARGITTDNTLLVFFLLVICAKGKSLRFIGISSLISGSFWIISAAAASRIGFITDIVYDGTRHSFGSIYMTDLMCHILTLCMLYYILRNGRMKIADYIVTALILAGDALFIKAKIGLVCLLILFAGTILYQAAHNRMNMKEKTKKAAACLMAVSFLLLCILMYVLTCRYTDSPDALYNRIGSLRTIAMRLKMGRQAFDNYDILSFGQKITERGNGAKQPGSLAPGEYYFLDISYIRILFHQGYMMLAAALLLFTGIQVRLYKCRRYYAMFVLTVFALDCAVEHHMLEVSYSLMAPMLFCSLDNIDNKIDK